MDFYSLSLIALALSLDAFGAALGIGFNNRLGLNEKFKFVLSFGFFQFLFSFIGAWLGTVFNLYIVALPQRIGGLMMIIVGLIILKEGFQNKESAIFLESKMYFIMGISVSIDALIIGFTVLSSSYGYFYITISSLYIGIVTFVISIIGFYIVKFLKKIEIMQKYSDYISGIILILFGMKMIIF